EYQRFIAGQPTAPPQVSWWRPWLDRVRGWKERGMEVGRVRVDDVPLTPYQRWQRWSEPGDRGGGGGIRHLPRARAAGLGLARDARLRWACRCTITGSLTTTGSC